MSARYVLHNDSTGQSWPYDSEPQLRTAARLYAAQNPRAGLSVTVDGVTHNLRSHQ